MSMLVRYKKAGGFVQLVKLLEGFGKEKQEKFLALVEKEDPIWAKVLKEKLLSVEKIFSWDTQVVSNITQRMHEKSLAALMHGLSEEQREKVLALLGHSEKRRLDSAFSEISPSPGEIATGAMQLIEETRSMVQTNALKLEKVDPSLVIEDNVEEQLSSMVNFTNFDENKNGDLDFGMAEQLGSGGTTDASVNAKEHEALRRKVINLTKEVNLLKRENQVMNEKLTQIKKIA